MEERTDEAVQLLHMNSIKTVKNWKNLGEKQKQRYPSGLVIILDEISRKIKDKKEGTEFLKKFIKITTLEQVQKKMKAKFEFIEREEGRKVVENCALNNLKNYSIQGPTISQNVGFIICSGGSGIGKRRTTNEMIGFLKGLSKIHPIFENTCSIYFDFKGGDDLKPFENDPTQISGLRIFSHGLCLSTVDDLPEELKQKFEELHKLKVFDISNILELIGEIYHEKLGTDEWIPLIIIMNEIQFTKNRFDSIEYKDIFKSLGDYCYSQYGKNENLKDKLIIIPVISGSERDLSLPLPKFKNYQFPLSPFSQDEIIMVLKQNVDEFWYDNKEKRRFWHLNGMIPRSLEYLIDSIKYIKRNEFKNEELLFEKLEEIISSYYDRINIPLHRELLYLCLSGVFSQSIYESNWFNELFWNGMIFQDPKSNKLLLPCSYFQSIIKYISGIPSDIFPNITSPFHRNSFEQLINSILYNKMKGKRDFESKNSIEISELFWGAHISDSIKNIHINVSILDINNEKISFLKETTNKCHLNSWKFGEKTLISNCKKNKFLVDSTITDQVNKIIFIIQKKYISNSNQDSEDQLKTSLWFDKISKIEKFKDFVEYKKIYVFITNGNISNKEKEIIGLKRDVIIIDQSVLSYFFPPNLLPYVINVE